MIATAEFRGLQVRHAALLASMALVMPIAMAQTTTQGPGQAPAAGMGAARAAGSFPNPLAGVVYTPAIYIDGGKYLVEKSVPADVSGGSVTNTEASGVKITARADKIGGLYVKGSEYTLSDATIDLVGNSGQLDDNTGIGAGVVAGEGSTVTLKKVKITTNGLKAAAATAAGGTLKVYDSTLIANGGKVPYENTLIGTGPGYVGPPEPLGITGNARATNVVGNSKAYYYNSTIIASGWGAMSTDSASPAVYLEVNDSIVRVTDSGYGTYADNGCIDVFNNTQFSSATYSGIISGNGKIYFNNVTEDKAVNSVMIHGPGPDFTRIATLEIKGGKLATKEAVVLVKSHNADIVMDGVKLAPKSGVLLQSVINDSKRSAMARWLASDKSTTPATSPITGVRATFRNMSMSGNIVHDDTMRTMTLNLAGTTFKGAVTGSIYTITDVSIALDASSKWTATKDSRVTLMGGTDVKAFDAPKGVTITAIAGKDTTLKGSYKLPSGGTLTVKAPA
ncbi:MAG: hypothetical protein QM808_00635 [Steroidobacteraceae bacterium]